MTAGALRIRHVRHRAKERYGLRLTKADVLDVDAFAALFGASAFERIAIPFRGRWLSAVFVPGFGVVTVLPRTTLNDKMKRRAQKILAKLSA